MDLNPIDAELVIGIVARIGVDTKAVAAFLKAELEEYSYRVFEIRLTDLIRGLKTRVHIVDRPCEERYNTLIDACNKLREDTHVGVMARLAVAEIVRQRKVAGFAENVQARNAYIINQIKRPEEGDLLRKVYGEHYVQVSCHASEVVRVDRLTRLISEDHPEAPKSTTWHTRAVELVGRDESEEDAPNGQRVREVFPLSDVIVDATTLPTTSKSIDRFLRVLFRDGRVTPTREEYGMEIANVAAKRSSSQSRQVGAAIFGRTMEVQAIGCNEVPKAGGGTYWDGDEHDGRDFTLNIDPNEQRRKALLIDLVLRLKDAKGLAPSLVDVPSIERFLFDRQDKLISESQVMDTLEYGRSVHAEMNAITDAARGGKSVKNCLLFTTTFPCHNCAKHIVSAGISEVIYNHPYPKSYAQELFSDSTIVDVNSPGYNHEAPPKVDKVIFRQFIGIIGPMYSRVFTKERWKSGSGANQNFVKRTASYIRRTPVPAYVVTEDFILDTLRDELNTSGYTAEK